MNDAKGMDNKKLQELLKLTADKLGTDPENLRNAAQNGDMGKILGKIQNDNVKKVLSDPEKARALLNSEQGKRLLEMFGLSDKGNK